MITIQKTGERLMVGLSAIQGGRTGILDHRGLSICSSVNVNAQPPHLRFSDLPHWITTEEAADFLRIPEKTVQQLCREGRMPGTKLGKHWRINKYKLNAWMSKGGSNVSLEGNEAEAALAGASRMEERQDPERNRKDSARGKGTGAGTAPGVGRGRAASKYFTAA